MAHDTARTPWPTDITATPEYDAALSFLTDGNDGHLFVTGRAGTGKSTLLRALRDLIQDEKVVVAPTGLSAVQVGGQTIHSFFSLPPRLIQPQDIRRSRNGRIMRKIKFLIIDEVSMVRSDLMAGIDQSLRVNRGRPHDSFGGVRLLMFGDLHQLPPVVQDPEVAAHLENTYGGPFFFSHSAFHEGAGTQCLELSQIFRQSDEVLIEILNQLRDGEVTEEILAILNTRVAPIRTLSEGQAYVILTPTNAAARRINLAYLEALPGEARAYEAGVTGDYSASAQPTEQTLVLKPGAKVIMLRNDPDGRWVNGTIGAITDLADTSVAVEIEGRRYDVEAVDWEQRRYAFDQTKDKVVETVAGTFRQLPLRLAWALTIHKAQGLTLDRVYIDLGRGTFAHGQAYVALSRCRSLDALALARPLQPRDVLFDPAALGYRSAFDSLL